MRDGGCRTTRVPIIVGRSFLVGFALAAPVSMLLYAQHYHQRGEIVGCHPAEHRSLLKHRIALPVLQIERRNIAMTVFQIEDRDVPRILFTERLAQEGMDLVHRELPEALIDRRFGLAPAQLRALIGGYSALIIRSETRITDALLAAAPSLKVVGRAGSGVDNIDLEAALRRGVLVVYAPMGNVLAAAEHTMALLLALARHMPSATTSLRAGRSEAARQRRGLDAGRFHHAPSCDH